MAATFISYRREDTAGYAGRLHESLQERFGERQIFRDVDTLQPGQDFVHAIDERLRDCRVLLALIGRSWATVTNARGTRRLDEDNDYVRLEIAAALARPGVLVIPVLLEGAVMPPDDQLPAAIRSLGRRQAVSLRDESWETDVDRLSAAIRAAGVTPHVAGSRVPLSAGRQLPSRKLAIRMALVAAVAVALFFWRPLGDASRRESPDGAPAERAAEPSSAAATISPIGSSGDGGGAAASPDRALPADPRPPEGAYAIDVPPVSEVAHDDLTYSLISASVVPQGTVNMLRLRVRVANDSRYDANFNDGNFRLALADQVLVPTSQLNAIVAGHATRQGIVTFDVPSHVTRATLRVTANSGRMGELPLSLAATRRAPRDEQADAGDLLAQAIITPVIREPRPLLGMSEASVRLNRVTTRRFANALRVSVTLRLSNLARYAISSSSLTLRAVVDDERIAPFRQPNLTIEPASDAVVEYVFDVPPMTAQTVLRATFGEATAEVKLDL